MNNNERIYNNLFNVIFSICFLIYSLKSINIGLDASVLGYVNLSILGLSVLLWVFNIAFFKVSSTKLTVIIILLLSVYIQFVFFDILFFLAFYMLLNSSNRKFMYLQVMIMIFTFIGTLIAVKFGFIENLLFYRSGDGVRQAFGFNHPNTLGMFVYAITINLLNIMNKSRYSLLKYTVLLIFNLYFYYISDSRTASFISLGTIIIIIVLGFINLDNKIMNNKLIIGGILSFILAIVGLSTYFSFVDNYTELNKLFTNRLYSSYMFITEFGFNLLGDEIPGVLNTPTGEVIIDSGYINLILRKGIVFTIIFFMAIFNRIWNNKFTNKEGILILSVFCTLMFESYGFSIFMFQILFFDYVGKRKEYRE
jgi:oligosaccharide repeat unit polymerase wzy